MVGLVDDVDISDLQQTGLQRLDFVAGTGYLDYDHSLGYAHDVDFVLSRSDRLYENNVHTKGVQGGNGIDDAGGEATLLASGRDAANKYAGVFYQVLHPDP